MGPAGEHLASRSKGARHFWRTALKSLSAIAPDFAHSQHLRPFSVPANRHKSRRKLSVIPAMRPWRTRAAEHKTERDDDDPDQAPAVPFLWFDHHHNHDGRRHILSHLRTRPQTSRLTTHLSYRNASVPKPARPTLSWLVRIKADAAASQSSMMRLGHCPKYIAPSFRLYDRRMVHGREGDGQDDRGS